MTLKMKLVRETSAARLYENAAGAQLWVPKSVCDRTLKFPAEPGRAQVHEVDVAGWWLAKNPFHEEKQRSLI